jgi:hypothetical protein
MKFTPLTSLPEIMTTWQLGLDIWADPNCRCREASINENKRVINPKEVERGEPFTVKLNLEIGEPAPNGVIIEEQILNGLKPVLSTPTCSPEGIQSIASEPIGFYDADNQTIKWELHGDEVFSREIKYTLIGIEAGTAKIGGSVYYRNQGEDAELATTGENEVNVLATDCSSLVDTNCDGCVTLDEVVDYINLWAEHKVDLSCVVDAINRWAEGCPTGGEQPKASLKKSPSSPLVLPGELVKVYSDLDVGESEEDKPCKIALTDQIPDGWKIVSGPADVKYELEEGRISWEVEGDDVYDRRFEYTVEIPDTEPIGTKTISGYWLYSGTTAPEEITAEITVGSPTGTEVSGPIDTDTTWTQAGSPYIVVGHVTVGALATLTIEPGVTVKFDGNYYLQINGELLAQGSEGSEILFTSNQTNPAAGNWQGIYLNGALASSRLIYCRIEYSQYGVKLTDCLGGLNPIQISHCTIQDISKTGIYCANSNPLISDCIIQNLGEYSIYCDKSNSDIANNTIQDYASSGVYVTGSPVPKIHNNTLTHRYHPVGNGIYLNQTSPEITNNVIEKNATGIYCYRK